MTAETKTKTTLDNIDIVNLIDDGHLDLDKVFAGARWSSVEEIDTYIAMCGGSSGDSPMTLTIMLESSEMYGITAFRWIELDDAGSYDTGEITLSRSEAVEQGESLAAERDESDEGDDDDEDAYFVDSTLSGWAVIRHDGQYAEFADSPEAEEAAERLNSGLAKESEYYWSEKS